MEEKKLHKAYPILSLTKADIFHEGFSEKEIDMLEDFEMYYIAEKIGEVMFNDMYWTALKLAVEHVLKFKREKEKNEK